MWNDNICSRLTWSILRMWSFHIHKLRYAKFHNHPAMWLLPFLDMWTKCHSLICVYEIVYNHHLWSDCIALRAISRPSQADCASGWGGDGSTRCWGASNTILLDTGCQWWRQDFQAQYQTWAKNKGISGSKSLLCKKQIFFWRESQSLSSLTRAYQWLWKVPTRIESKAVVHDC